MTDLHNSESELIINEQKIPDMEFLKFFDPITMSIHLKENQKPLGKKGKPGSFELVELDTKTLDRDYLEIITTQILAAIDDETLQIRIDSPKAYFLQKLTYPTAFVVDKDNVNDGGRTWTDNPNGTGPFKLTDYRNLLT